MPIPTVSLSVARALRCAAALGAACLAVPASASGDIFWSVGVAPVPGVVVGASNLPPPVYAPPRVVYTPPPVVYTPPPVVYTSPVVVMQPSGPWHKPHPGRGHAYGHDKWAKPGHGHGHSHARGHGH